MKRRRSTVPLMLFWNKRDQLRFINAVEKFCSLVNDMEVVLAASKRRKKISLTPAVQPASV